MYCDRYLTPADTAAFEQYISDLPDEITRNEALASFLELPDLKKSV